MRMVLRPGTELLEVSLDSSGGDAPVAGYNFNSDWTPLLAGLSPAGMAASSAFPWFESYQAASTSL
jgi:hypothetical protein